MGLQVTTLLDYLNDVVELPERDTAKPLRVPISGIYKIKGALRGSATRVACCCWSGFFICDLAGRVCQWAVLCTVEHS